MTTTHGLDADGFTLSAVEVIGTACQFLKVHVFAVNITSRPQAKRPRNYANCFVNNRYCVMDTKLKMINTANLQCKKMSELCYN